VLKDTNVIVLSDEIYSELTFGDEKHVSIASIDGMWERTVVINGFSKAFSMTGWRLGYACGPKEIIKQITKIHQFAIMCAPTTSQYAAIEALKNTDDAVEKMLEEYDSRRRMIVKGFNDLGLTCREPKGAFYAFPSIQSTGMTSDEFCEKLLLSKKVALVPGTAFGLGGEGFVRASYCYSVEHIKEALQRIKEFLAEIGA
ncbi:MAG: aminotransferase class I/II-fold pyridoxal phosphate-dependent enzyme, partial [Acutalibacteraceae bacterium]|nr:aminotransferase class I/II-fold pyridoxal phosphate-dependent enzyme [Acutalibacteraceae bacterium]